MNRAYWERVAGDYEREVLSIFDEDAEGLVAEQIRLESQRLGGGVAADLGCGVGKFLPLLAKAFARVEACDLTATGLARARRQVAAEDGARVGFHRLDFAEEPLPFSPVDCVLCANALLMPELDERLRAWRAVTNQVREGGSLILVVPSLEAVQLERYAAVDDRLEAGESCRAALEESLLDEPSAVDLQMGVQPLEGVRTKLYLALELRQLIEQHEMSLLRLVRVPYSAGGWDWLVVAQRKRV